MELKSISFVVCKVWNQYQSNLYGIEIEIGSVYKRLNESINRTFMELKSATPTTAPSLFCVSIEPLWNWNFRPYHRRAESRPYQSNLYGIEITFCPNKAEGVTKYQSNLYGIEMQAHADAY